MAREITGELNWGIPVDCETDTILFVAGRGMFVMECLSKAVILLFEFPGEFFEFPLLTCRQ